MIPLADLRAYLDSLLKIGEFADDPRAFNGLQVENGGSVSKVAAAVDACEATIQAAAECGADLLLVHHGLFWGGLAPVTGPSYRKLKAALESGLAIYSAHLPLDAHQDFGNNALFCRALGFEGPFEPFLDFHGSPIGLKFDAAVVREILHSRIETEVRGRVVLAPGGPVTTRRIGVLTGGGGGEVGRAALEGVDTFITGEGPHWCYAAAEEAGVNLFLAGHYATEAY
ncbi:MAG: Nif3-like dinuclear metal center hexameric protein, partial [Terrimicrobiaceae bacterium]|nr:Nif3-like dinuclear metal center hexameric protein [Terrimicrobiaceae bacterium]